MDRRFLSLLVCLAAPGAPMVSSAQSIPSPSAALGIPIGADRTLADWSEINRYFSTLAAASPMVQLDTLGRTTQGRPMLLATISSVANIRKIEAIRAAQQRLADPRQLGQRDEARLVAEQPAVVVIQCNIHSTEIASSQMAMLLAHRLATNDTLARALEKVVVLLIPSANPDGQQMVVDWYEQGVGTRFEGGALPWLYHPYVGHDNNRDWFMVTQKETRLITDLLYRRWFPEVFYDVHQQGNRGMRLTVPPHVDPINPNIDPLIVRAINHIGSEMSLALEERGKKGVGDNATYDLWWHGGARSTPTRHNTVGVLTEAASVRIATPIVQDSADLTGHRRGLPVYTRRVNFPNPWPGGTWRQQDIIDYEMIAAEALIAMLAQQREQYVRNFVRLGRRAVEAGRTEAPRAYVIPARQHDPSAARRLADVLWLGAVEVDQATVPFSAGGVRYDSGSYVIRMDQPYRAHAKDLLEPQEFPAYTPPGGSTERPYDVAGWTLPLQMGVRVARIDSLPDLTTRRMASPDSTRRTRSCVARAGEAAGEVVLDPRDTEGRRLLARALSSGATARIARRPTMLARGGVLPAGAVFLRGSTVHPDPNMSCGSVARGGERSAGLEAMRPMRIGLYRPWTSEMDEGWTRWVLEDFGIQYSSVTDSMVRAGRLRDQFDVILVPDMSLRAIRDGMSADSIPARYAGGLGTAGIDTLRRFAEAGGTLVLMDGSTALSSALGLPVRRIVVPSGGSADDGSPDGATVPESLYAPGSIFRVLVDRDHPVGYGMPDTAAVYFSNSVTFEPTDASKVQVIARYPARQEDILLSGFLQGGGAIAGKAAAVEVMTGRGRVIMFGFRPQHRAQSYGTFKMLFNALLDGRAAAGRR